MIITHRLCPEGKDKLLPHTLQPGEALAGDVLWIDLLSPTLEEDRQVEALLGISVPTREDMNDIEPSELLWSENGTRYMTMRLLIDGDTDDPIVVAVTFILTAQCLVTVRYSEPKAFALFLSHAVKSGGCGASPEAIMSGLVDAVIDRAADVLQDAGGRLDALSRGVFDDKVKQGGRNTSLQRTLQALGRHGDRISKSRESLVSIERVLLSLSATLKAAHVPAALREEVKSTLRDLQSLEEHASFQSSKIQFLLDATLGLVNLEQNNIIKLFSVMAVIFMPPTLVASVYGMNFKSMPELEWAHGYPMALILMIVVAVAPYLIFRWKNWL
ncbi:magnesium transporter CorA family protein [Labrys neptuniae]